MNTVPILVSVYTKALKGPNYQSVRTDCTIRYNAVFENINVPSRLS